MSNHDIEISAKGKWITVPAVYVDGNTITVRGSWLKIASVHDEAWLESEVRNPDLCVKELSQQANGLRADIFTFTQKLPATIPKYNYPREWDSVAAIRLTTFKQWWEKLPQETRKNVRRSQKRGVRVTVAKFDDALVEGIRDVNNDSSVRQGARNFYFSRTLDELRKDYSAFIDRSEFICAYLGDELIGFLKIVHRRETASILNLVVKPSHSDKRPANALIARAVELCQEKGASFITYGMLHYGNKRSGTLLEFKMRNGFEEIRVPRYFVPLTTWGSICVKAKLHRGLLAILPSSAITLGVSLRTKWYNFTTRQAGVAQ
jgi:GNAT acetyltransferase-like protein